MSTCPKSCKEWMFCLVGVSAVVAVFLLPTIFFYSWRDGEVNNWRNQTDLLDVYNHIRNCTGNVTAKEDTTQVATKWSNKLTSLCKPYLEGACPVGNIAIVHNDSTLLSVEHKSGKTPLRVEVEQVHDSTPLNCSLHQLCSAVFPRCTSLNIERNEAVNSTVIIKLSHSCTLHSDLLMTFGSIRTTPMHVNVVSNVYDSTSLNGSVECHPQYTRICGLCVPDCSRYHIYLRTNGGWNLEELAVIAASVNSVLGGVIFTALSIARRKEMMIFPTVLVFYENILEMALALLVTAPRFANRMNWFYPYKDVVRTLYAPPTTFCTISGFLFHFTMVAIILLWLIHFVFLAILFKFPFFGKTMMKKAGLIHAVSVPTALLVCLIGPTVTVLWYGYFTARFPNLLCIPSNLDVLFYTIILPLNIFGGVCAAITLAMVWDIHKIFGSDDNKLKRKLSPSTADHIHTSKVKLFLLAAIFAILLSLLLTRFSQNFADQLSYISKLLAYPHCILTGKGQCSVTTNTDGITAAATTLYDAMTYVLLGSMTYVNLIFPLKPSDFRRIKHKLCCLCAKYSPKSSEHETQRANV